MTTDPPPEPGQQPSPWRSERDLGPAGVRALLRSQFPELAAERIEFLAAGWDSEVFEVDGVWVFRFPKRAGVVSHLESEIAVLPLLAPRLPLAVPVFEFVGRPEGGFPFPFVGYAKLPGRSAQDTDSSDAQAILDPVVAFLAVLHGLEPAGPLSAVRGWPAQPDEPTLLERVAGLGLRDEPELAAATAWLAARPAPPTYAGRRVLRHDDLGMEHVLVDPASLRVTGIIDWGDMSLGDPVADFVGLAAWAGVEAVREACARVGYSTDPAFFARVHHRAVEVALAQWCDSVAFGGPTHERTRAQAALKLLL